MRRRAGSWYLEWLWWSPDPDLAVILDIVKVGQCFASFSAIIIDTGLSILLVMIRFGNELIQLDTMQLFV